MNFLKRKKRIPNGSLGCFATNRITVDGARVGYMYREDPDENSDLPDSGWRFFAGDESDDYTNNPDNIRIFAIQTICDYDKDIISYLNAPYGSAWVRKGSKFIEDK